MIKILVTGGAGFIGSSLVDELLKENNYQITVIDNFDPFYDKQIKQKNIEYNLNNPNYKFIEEDIRNYASLKSKISSIDIIVHLAAKAGVRPSILDPVSYQQVNVQGTQNLLEMAKELNCKQFVFGSSSSVYGINPNVPWIESDYVLQPISPYAATKVSGELLGHVYSKLYDIRFIALRFFTVYGPRQRPDLAIHKFAKLMLEDKAIPMYGDGSSQRDYTYVEDIVSGVISAINYTLTNYEIINIGNNHTISLSKLIQTLENTLNKKAIIETLPNQLGDVPQTYANIDKANRLLNYQPKTSIEEGIQKFVDWLRNY